MKYNSKLKVGREGRHRIGLKLRKGLVKGGWWSSKMEFYQECTVKLHMLMRRKNKQEYQQIIVQGGRCHFLH